LEAAWQLDRVSGAESLAGFIRSQLNSAAHLSGPLVVGAHRSPECLAEFDRACDAMLSNHVANRASRAQGQAFLLAGSRIFPNSQLSGINSTLRKTGGPGHFAPVLGIVCQTLEVELETTVRLFLFLSLRSMISAAVRLGIVGPMEGQSIQWQLTPYAQSLVEPVCCSTIDGAAQTSPIFDLFQGMQDRLYSRLFQS
jgi:urease accessory protein